MGLVHYYSMLNKKAKFLSKIRIGHWDTDSLLAPFDSPILEKWRTDEDGYNIDKLQRIAGEEREKIYQKKELFLKKETPKKVHRCIHTNNLFYLYEVEDCFFHQKISVSDYPEDEEYNKYCSGAMVTEEEYDCLYKIAEDWDSQKPINPKNPVLSWILEKEAMRSLGLSEEDVQKINDAFSNFQSWLEPRKNKIEEDDEDYCCLSELEKYELYQECDCYHENKHYQFLQKIEEKLKKEDEIIFQKSS